MSQLKWSDSPLLQMDSAQLEAHSHEWAFLVVRFEPTGEQTLAEYLSKRLRIKHSCVLLLDEHFPTIALQEDGQHLTCIFDDANRALSAGLLMLGQHIHSVNIGLGFGQGYQFDYFQCLDLVRLKNALPFGNSHELQVTSNFKDQCTIPDGIGAFTCPPALAKRTGLQYWILKDYR